ncbi:hypothetical protein C5167_007026 [Papaver somniferum]|uniref:Uncharacterized protein n=1 Tax=Papaver somniferum TaxID=3469 RepID=A0A4Y7JIU9_PAPSO|nr:hypothetical protein C5167_007026 [Papaver somniferum]
MDLRIQYMHLPTTIEPIAMVRGTAHVWVWTTTKAISMLKEDIFVARAGRFYVMGEIIDYSGKLQKSPIKKQSHVKGQDVEQNLLQSSKELDV